MILPLWLWAMWLIAVQPIESTVTMQPAQLLIPLHETVTTQVQREGGGNMAGATIAIIYDPRYLSVATVRAGESLNMGQGGVDYLLEVATPEPNQTDKALLWVTVAMVSPDMGRHEGSLLEIDWRGEGITTETPLVFEAALSEVMASDGTWHTLTTINSTATIVDTAGHGFFRVSLQGGKSLEPIETAEGVQHVTLMDNHQTLSITTPQGVILPTVPPYINLEIRRHGYVRAISERVGDAQPRQITLIAGDVNSDDFVDIFDLVLMARQFGQPQKLPLTAEFEAMNYVDIGSSAQLIDIFDLALVAGNYGYRGPTIFD